LIDPDPVRTTDFRLSEEEKLFLVARGRAAALRFLHKRNLVDESSAKTAETTAVEERAKAMKARRRRKWRRYVSAGLFVLLLIAGGLLFLLDRGRDADPQQQMDSTYIAATGRLIIDARPWAHVDSVTARGGQQTVTDAETPLNIAVRDGRYTVALRGPNGEIRTQDVYVRSDTPGRVIEDFPLPSTHAYRAAVGQPK
jgi:hypothetical protein